MTALGQEASAEEVVLRNYTKLFDLTGKRVGVIGAARGIGRECAVALAAHGATVVAIDR